MQSAAALVAVLGDLVVVVELVLGNGVLLPGSALVGPTGLVVAVVLLNEATVLQAWVQVVLTGIVVVVLLNDMEAVVLQGLVVVIALHTVVTSWQGVLPVTMAVVVFVGWADVAFAGPVVLIEVLFAVMLSCNEGVAVMLTDGSVNSVDREPVTVGIFVIPVTFRLVSPVEFRGVGNVSAEVVPVDIEVVDPVVESAVTSTRTEPVPEDTRTDTSRGAISTPFAIYASLKGARAKAAVVMRADLMVNSNEGKPTRWSCNLCNECPWTVKREVSAFKRQENG